MTTLFKTLFDRRKEPTTSKLYQIEGAHVALQNRVERLVLRDSNRFDFDQPTTDVYGRALQ